jgi:hypothetical protein
MRSRPAADLGIKDSSTDEQKKKNKEIKIIRKRLSSQTLRLAGEGGLGGEVVCFPIFLFFFFYDIFRRRYFIVHAPEIFPTASRVHFWRPMEAHHNLRAPRRATVLAWEKSSAVQSDHGVHFLFYFIY